MSGDSDCHYCGLDTERCECGKREDEAYVEIARLKTEIDGLKSKIAKSEEYHRRLVLQIDAGCRGRCALDECVCMPDDLQREVNELRVELDHAQKETARLGKVEGELVALISVANDGLPLSKSFPLETVVAADRIIAAQKVMKAAKAWRDYYARAYNIEALLDAVISGRGPTDG